MNSLAIKPAWSPLTVTGTILGFMIYWPLGLAMIAYVVWGDRFMSESQELTGKLRSFGRRSGMTGQGVGGGFGGFQGTGFTRTGNVAFDDYREATLKRLEEERVQLEAQEREFADFMKELRRARDKEEFDRFMQSRGKTVEGDPVVSA